MWLGASESSVDLLPNPSLEGSWTKDLPTDDGQESDQIFAFDGKTTAIEVTSSKLKFDLGASFTVAMWMKHDVSDDEKLAKRGVKEHILCHSDGDGNVSCHVVLCVVTATATTITTVAGPAKGRPGNCPYS